MPKLAVLHHQPERWAEAIRQVEPRIEVRAWHPRAFPDLDWSWLEDCEALFTWKMPLGLVARMPRLRWIQNSGAGVDHLLQHPELPQGVQISRADGKFGFWMARYVLAHLLEESQALQACRRDQQDRIWSPKRVPEDLNGQMAIVVGLGRIGRVIALALVSLGLKVSAIVRHPRPDPDFPLHDSTSLAQLLASARLLVLCAPLTPETENLIDDACLAHGHDRLLLINVGRGQLVEDGALLRALDEGRLGRAVLDVFRQEPLPLNSPFWLHPKVTVTPHHSGPSEPKAILEDIAPNFWAYALGQGIPEVVDLQRGY